MAAKTKLERRDARKERLIKQNDLYRRDLMAEEHNLRDGAELVERGHSFYRLATKLTGGLSIFSPKRKKESTVSKVWNGCTKGLNILRNLQNR